jgi:uncharacterized membrane-anchored protein
MQPDSVTSMVSKVPAVTLAFWSAKIIATTLGETAGDALSMSLNLGYLLSTGIFALAFIVMVAWQVNATRCHPALYWLTIVATTTVGTTLADFADRSLGIGYAGGSALLLGLVIASLVAWRLSLGRIDSSHIQDRPSEAFYWLTIMCSQTLGTALGDWTADTQGLGYAGAALLFGGALLLCAVTYRFTQVSRALLFWLAFILTRPLGAVLGDFMDKPLDHGGLNLDRFQASLVLILVLIAVLIYTERRNQPAASEPSA